MALVSAENGLVSAENGLVDSRNLGSGFHILRARGEDVEMGLGDRVYRIRGLNKNSSFEVMKINVRVHRGERFYIDTLDLYNARHRSLFVKAAADELKMEAEIIQSDLCKVLLKCEELQEKRILQILKPEKKEVLVAGKDREEALELLRDPDLLRRVVDDLERCGLVGERENAEIMYLCGISRVLDDPQHVIVQASSSAGKSSMVEMVLAFTPAEQKVKYSAVTGQSLFYMEETELAHKTVFIAEAEGAVDAIYAIKIMQSEKELCIASTGKDTNTGKQVTHHYRVGGPAQFFFTTAKEEVDEELQNRGYVLTANENREQTQAIHKVQRESETLAGMLLQQEREAIVRKHQNVQRLLRPLKVVNPYAERLTFLDTRLRTRRDHKKYLGLIRSIALLHQYRREVKKIAYNGHVVEYIEVIPDDIAIANRLMNQLMGTSLDELAPQTRRLLELIERMVAEHCASEQCGSEKFLFTRKDVRDYTGWTDTKLKIHLAQLVDLEYMVIRHGNKCQRFFYELLYRGEGKDKSKFMLGLLDVDNIRSARSDVVKK